MKRIIKFEKEDCNPCIMVSQFLSSKAVLFESINPFDCPELASQYRIRSVPTTILLRDNDELMRTIGYKPDELNKILEVFCE